MNIAIQGHPIRGKEVIQILESLGGKNDCPLTGKDERFYYYIYNDSHKGICCHDCNYVNECKKYTLDEFEKEFPFKIGDIVLLKGINDPYEIIALEWYMNKLCYKLDNGLHYAPETLTTYKEMKEERNITLTLDKAQEWYKKGGELKEIALQAFSEKELNPLPRSWEEFCEKYPVRKGECFLGSEDKINIVTLYNGKRTYKNWIPSKELAEAHLAMIQLEQLRNYWRQGWEPKPHESVYTIKFSNGGLRVYYFSSREFLSFPTREMAEEFLECFRDLIEKAGDLI